MLNLECTSAKDTIEGWRDRLFQQCNEQVEGHPHSGK